MLVVEAPGVARRSGRPATEEDRRREHWRPSTVFTLLEVDASEAVQRSGRPIAEKDRTGEHQPASPMGEVVGHRSPSPGTGSHLNGAGPGVEGEGPRGVAIAATRGDGGGGVAAGTAMAAAVGSTAVTPPSSVPRLSRVVVVGHRRRWHSIVGEARPREGGR
jgi:hypothetical protein